MQIKIKPWLSLVAIGVFIYFAMASEFLEESSNFYIQPKHCAQLPNFSGNFQFTVEYKRRNGDPIPNATGRAVVTEQLVDYASSDCESNIINSWYIDIALDANGKFTSTPIPFTHTNSEDLFRVEVLVYYGPGASYEGFRVFDVAYYNRVSIGIVKFAPNPL